MKHTSSPLHVVGSREIEEPPARNHAPLTSTRAACDPRSRLVFGDRGNYNAAVAEYTKAIGIAPDYPYFTNRAHAYQQLKDFRAAVADYSEAVRIKPEDSGSYFRRGNLYAEMGEHDAAISDFRKAVDTATDEVTRTAYRGRLYHVQGRKEDAATAYRSVIADPNVDADAKALFQTYLDQVLKP